MKREWKKILEAPRFLLIRQMHKTLENNCKLESIPKLLNVSIHTLRELKTALTEFCVHPANIYLDTILKSTTAVRTKLLEEQFEKTEDFYSKNADGQVPLHYAAKHGHLQTCKYIIGKVEDKNPKDNDD